MAPTSRTRLATLNVGIVSALIAAASVQGDSSPMRSADALRESLRRPGTGRVGTLTLYNLAPE